MNSNNLSLVDALKQGILLERKGVAFYEVAAKQENSKSVQNFFQEMADEERVHEQFLSHIYSKINNSGTISNIDLTGLDTRKASRMVIDSDLIAKISAASYEAAAISAAIEMEKKSIDLYASQALNTQNADEKKMFTFLADWEKEHLNVLENLNKEIQEKIWFDNSFWPF